MLSYVDMSATRCTDVILLFFHILLIILVNFQMFLNEILAKFKFKDTVRLKDTFQVAIICVPVLNCAVISLYIQKSIHVFKQATSSRQPFLSSWSNCVIIQRHVTHRGPKRLTLINDLFH